MKKGDTMKNIFIIIGLTLMATSCVTKGPHRMERTIVSDFAERIENKEILCYIVESSSYCVWKQYNGQDAPPKLEDVKPDSSQQSY